MEIMPKMEPLKMLDSVVGCVVHSLRCLAGNALCNVSRQADIRSNHRTVALII
jgi:hypothetical protein